MNASARSSMAKVTSPPAPAPACSLPAWRPSSGATSFRSSVASWIATSRRSARGIPLAGRALAQRDVDRLLLAVADDLDLDRVAGIVVGDQPREVGLVDDLLAIDRRDHVSTGIHLLA